MLRISAHRAARRSPQEGSAYLFVLLALLVLTAIGLSLVAVTQTEVQIGGVEKSLNRVLFPAEGAIRMQFAMSRFKKTEPRSFDLGATSVPGATSYGRADVAAFFPIFTGNCALCSVNKGEDRVWAANYLTNSESRRTAIVGGVETELASRRISEMFFIQPELDRDISEALRTFDAAATTEDPTRAGLETLKY